jgi:hypothetical protein
MKRGGAVVLVAAVLCATAVIVWWRETGGPARSADYSDVTRKLRDAKDGEAVLLDAQPAQPPPGKNSAVERYPDYAGKLRAAPDYLEYARSLVDAARAGDHAAQFHIFRALDYCAIEYRFHIDRGGVRRTLDDALRTAAGRWPYDSETVRLVYARCHTMVESGANDLGKRSDWLKLASDGGYPPAQAIASHRNVDLPLSGDSEELTNSEEGRRLLASAIRSGDPEVLWEIGNFALAPKTDDDLAIPEQAWLLAACQRGLDCSPQSDAVRAMCIYDPNCQPYETVADVLRRADGTGFPDLEARARRINEKIDAGDWSALGF